MLYVSSGALTYPARARRARVCPQLDEAVVETLLDLVDKNGDGEIHCDEFAESVLSGANSYFFDDAAEGYQSSASAQGL